MKIRIEVVLAAVATQLLAIIGVADTGRAAAAEASACTTDIVASAAGPVCGSLTPTASGREARAFLGIPFAESVAGEGRWRAPEQKRRWSDTLAALEYGAICPQPGYQRTTPAPTLHHHRLPTRKVAPVADSGQSRGQSEDCLSLNVWTPSGATPDSGLPVMVFIYGGSFEAGDSGDPLYDGAYLAANRDVILVSFNYRLGVLGFLAADGLSGNYGFMDQQLALSWVRKNIRAFGGDPGKVTIFGQSAGAMSVSLHLFSAPGSAPLFRAGIMESAIFALPYKRLEDQVNVGNIFMQGLNCRDLDCLRSKDVDELLAAQQGFTPEMSTVFSGPRYYLPFSPVIDGALLTRQPLDGAADAAAAKPILLGSNRNDALLFVADRSIAPDAYAAWAASLFGTAFQRVIARYPAVSGGANGALWGQVQTDNFMTCSTRHIAAKAKGPVYAYLFERQPSFRVWGGVACREDGNVCHGDELPFVFHSAGRIDSRFTSAEDRLSNAVMDYWTNFATWLDPNGGPATAERTRWPRFREDAKDYMVLNVPESSARRDPHGETCAFWDGVGYSLIEPWAPEQGARP